MELTPEELGRISADREYWEQFAREFDLVLVEWTYRDTGKFTTNKGPIIIKGFLRDAIMRKLGKK